MPFLFPRQALVVICKLVRVIVLARICLRLAKLHVCAPERAGDCSVLLEQAHLQGGEGMSSFVGALTHTRTHTHTHTYTGMRTHLRMALCLPLCRASSPTT